MGLVSITQLANGTTADATAVDANFNNIANVLNGNIDATNLAGGTIGASAYADGWTPVIGITPTTVTYNGNRSYSLLFNGVNLTTYISNGMRLKATRTVTAPTQCTSLNGTTQFYSKTSPAGMTFTTTFSAMAWVKPAAYVAGGIVSRWNATNGWLFFVNASGQLNVQAGNGTSVNSYQSLPLNKWSHVAATYNAGTVAIYIDGVLVPSTGSTAVSITQAGNLEVGSYNATNPFNGKIAQAAVFSAVLNAATIQATISQGLAGTETSLISAYSFNNSINDLNANANNLTANGSAVATNADSPFTQDDNGTPTGATDCAIVTSKVFSTNTTLTVQVPEGCAIPTSGGVSALAYSTQKVPYGFPAQRSRWAVEFISRSVQSQASAVAGTWYNIGSSQLLVPVGDWELKYAVQAISTSSTTVNLGTSTTLATAAATETESLFTANLDAASCTQIEGNNTRSNPVRTSTAQTYYLNSRQFNGTSATLYQYATDGATRIAAENAYL